MRIGFVGLAFAAAVIAGTWAWLGAPVAMPHAPLAAGEKLWCISYAPYRGSQTPYDPGTKIVDVYIRYLRKKIDAPDQPSLIQTVRGVGYMIASRADAALSKF